MQNTFKDLSLEGAVQVLQDLNSRKLDVVVPIGHIQMNTAGNIILPYMAGKTQATAALNLSDHATNQVADKMGIPARYFRRCLETGDGLAAVNFNHWATKEWEEDPTKARRMLVRSYLDENGVTGTMRAFLSNSGYGYVQCRQSCTKLNTK